MRGERARWWRGLGAAGVSVVLVACSASGGPGADSGSDGAHAGRSLPGGSIVFDRATSAGDELFQVAVDGGVETDLGAGITGVGARFSPDGDRLTYARRSATGGERAEVFTLDVEEGSETSVGRGACPTWTADGEGLVVSLADGLHRIELTGGSQQLDPDPQACGVEAGEGRYVLWGHDETLQLLEGTMSETLAEAPGCGIGPVDVDGSSERIAYTVACEPGDPEGGLWVLDLGLRDVVQVSDEAAYGASWSPDGRWIATTIGVQLDDDSWRYDLWVVSVVDDQRRQIAAGPVGQPTWRRGS